MNWYNCAIALQIIPLPSLDQAIAFLKHVHLPILLDRRSHFIPLTYLVLDGHFGNNNALQMARQVNLHIISKLRHDSALYIPYKNPDPNRHSRRKYAQKLDYSNIPDAYLCKSTIEEDIKTDIYQTTLLHKEFAQALNIVILVKTNLQNNVSSHVILFSSDLKLSFDKIIDYYKLRFQIEFNFRDAKQFWGLEDFMNLSQTAVTNAANLAFFMVNLSHHLLSDFRQHNPDSGIIDLKAHYRGFRYVHEILKMLPQTPEPILLNQIFASLLLWDVFMPFLQASKPRKLATVH